MMSYHIAQQAARNTPIGLVLGVIFLLLALIVFIFFFLNKLPFMQDRAKKRKEKKDKKRGGHEK